MLKTKYLFLLLVLANLLIFYAIFRYDNNLHVVFCDVGQGDGILIYKKNIQIVVDGGPDRSILSCLGKHISIFDRTIEYVVLTNSDFDHYGGLVDIFRRYRVLGYGTSGVIKDDIGFKELTRSIQAENTAVAEIFSGAVLKVGEVSLSSIWPEKDLFASTDAILEGADVNARSVVLRLEYGLFSALLAGDIVPPATDELVSLARPGLARLTSVDILKVPHHGSKNGLTRGMVEVARPEIAIISAGKNNRFGHPHQETLDLLKGIKTLRTDQEGEIEVVTDGKSWEVK